MNKLNWRSLALVLELCFVLSIVLSSCAPLRPASTSDIPDGTMPAAQTETATPQDVWTVDETVSDLQNVTARSDISVVLGRPEPGSMTANIVTQQPSSVYVAWGESGQMNKSSVVDCSETKPAVLVMNGLEAGKRYTYTVYHKKVGAVDFSQTQPATFSTPKNAGTTFTFAVQSDSHVLNKADPELYALNMKNIAAQQPDLLMDLGDTFLNDQTKSNAQYQNIETLRKTYLQLRPYFDVVTRSAPLFLAIGNHEGEYGTYLDGTGKNLAEMAGGLRKLYYPNPEPDSFYSGNTVQDPFLCNVEDYYAFNWGDALFVVVDPYRYCTAAPTSSKGGWDWSLGKAQYDWFRKTLETSTAKYKFVFSHHAIGNVRGGAEVAKLYEWGGYDKGGAYSFDKMRPGWGKPIQQIMKDANVTIFFQGHDHLFSREVVDGVVYQTVPKPAERIPDQQNNYSAYPDGDTLMNSGFLAVRVSDAGVQVDYIRNYFVSTLPQQGNTGVVYSYTVAADGTMNILKKTVDDLTTYGASDTGKKPKNGKGGKGGKGGKNVSTKADKGSDGKKNKDKQQNGG